MAEKQRMPFGLWKSPISATAQGGKLRLEQVLFDTDDSLLWAEAANGKCTLMYKKGADAAREISGGQDVGGGVGYGGGDFTAQNGTAVFASQGRLYRVSLETGQPYPITPGFGNCASPVISPDGNNVIYVHTYEEKDCIALANSDGSAWPRILVSGADFYMQPAWHPNGRQIAWVEWNHPHMPWDGCKLISATVSESGLDNITHIAGDENTPVFQPSFSANGHWLAYIANDGEWDTLYAIHLESGDKKALVTGAALMAPAWVQGMQLFAWNAASSQIYYFKNERGWRTLWVVDVNTGKSEAIDISPYTWVDQISASAQGNRLALIASSSKIPSRVVTIENGNQRIERRSSDEALHPDDLPEPQPIEWAAPDGTAVHGLYYPPTSRSFSCDGLPPAIINIHGGPTSSQSSSYNAEAAYFATRGYAYLEVNYRGSSMYGRRYMLMLRQKWGLVDTEDAAGAAGALAELGLADPKRIVIMGGSSGGFTVLNALIHHPGLFRAGISRYGVANLFDIIIGTHKFEQHYNDSLVGQLPEAAERYKAWSPVFHADQIREPMAVFQGADDKVVPPAHSEQIVSTLRANKIPHVYRLYPGEGHGFRKTENIIDYYQTLDEFLSQYVLF